MENIITNNLVTISGEIVSDFIFSHEVMGEKFYIVKLLSIRESGNKDTLPIMVSDRMINVNEDWNGRFVKVSGQLRTYNKHNEESKNKLLLFVFVKEFEFWKDDRLERLDDENNVFIDGFICKHPIYRETPLGREITDILMAVNRPYGKSDYIPCIAWGRNAVYASGLEVGTHMKIAGRLQSREYQKRVSDEEYETRTAYEVSANTIEVIEETEE